MITSDEALSLEEFPKAIAIIGGGYNFRIFYSHDFNSVFHNLNVSGLAFPPDTLPLNLLEFSREWAQKLT